MTIDIKILTVENVQNMYLEHDLRVPFFDRTVCPCYCSALQPFFSRVSTNSSGLSDFSSPSGNEITGTEVSVGCCHLNITNVYSRSNDITNDLQAFCLPLQCPTLILGDFNLNHPF